MKNLFLSYENSLLLKDEGFDEPCLGFYYHQNKYITCNPSVHLPTDFSLTITNAELGSLYAPLYCQAFKFFRDNYNLNGLVGYCDDDSSKFMAVIDKSDADIDYDMNVKDTYEEAELVCLQKLIELCKKK